MVNLIKKKYGEIYNKAPPKLLHQNSTVALSTYIKPY